MNAKEFIEDLIKNELKSSLNKDTISSDTIACVSESQLDDISKLFGQGDLNGRDNNVRLNSSSAIH